MRGFVALGTGLLLALSPGCASGGAARRGTGESPPPASILLQERPEVMSLEDYSRRATGMRGCTGMESGDVAFENLYVHYGADGGPGQVRASDAADIVRKAASIAEDHGWRVPPPCILVSGSETPGETRVVVDPMTQENLLAARIDLKRVDWVIVRSGR